jgi:predicted CopG family antitoxin
MPRKHVSVTSDAYAALEAVKRDGESWSECFERVAREVAETDTANGPQTVAVENVDEIARRAADEVENRMTRR